MPLTVLSSRAANTTGVLRSSIGANTFSRAIVGKPVRGVAFDDTDLSLSKPPCWTAAHTSRVEEVKLVELATNASNIV